MFSMNERNFRRDYLTLSFPTQYASKFDPCIMNDDMTLTFFLEERQTLLTTAFKHDDRWATFIHKAFKVWAWAACALPGLRTTAEDRV